jgi:hypothetical protein
MLFSTFEKLECNQEINQILIESFVNNLKLISPGRTHAIAILENKWYTWYSAGIVYFQHATNYKVEDMFSDVTNETYSIIEKNSIVPIDKKDVDSVYGFRIRQYGSNSRFRLFYYEGLKRTNKGIPDVVVNNFKVIANHVNIAINAE